MNKIKGTDKQIKWASQIRDARVKEILHGNGVKRPLIELWSEAKESLPKLIKMYIEKKGEAPTKRVHFQNLSRFSNHTLEWVIYGIDNVDAAFSRVMSEDDANKIIDERDYQTGDLIEFEAEKISRAQKGEKR